uniref:Ciliogenesis and planar polarity effector 2 n=1 Tax=Xiphophorus couchianus TaxID=32473 RepID=A0A3B5M956_9TELE
MSLVTPGAFIVPDWHRCKDSKEYFNKIIQKKNRKNFVGKTALAARLAGLNIPSVHHETTGIQTTVVYWPVKLRENGRVLFFRLQLWDCGENALRRFDHLLPSCKEQVDAVLFLFSFTDRTSFQDLSNQMTKWTESTDCLVKVVVGTKTLFANTVTCSGKTA